MTLEVEPGDTVNLLMNIDGLKKHIRGIVLHVSEKTVSVLTEYRDEIVFRTPKLTSKIVDTTYEIQGVSDHPLSLKKVLKEAAQ